MRFSSSYHQQRLWFIDHFEKDDLYKGGPVYHNIPLFIRLPVVISPERLQAAFAALLERHSVLRTKLVREDGNIFQEVVEMSAVSTEQLLTAVTELATRKESLRVIPFEMETGLLLRAYYETTSHHTNVLLVIHHAITDRYTLNVLRRELTALLDNPAVALPAVPRYSDFSNWQNSLSDEALEPLFFHWQLKLKDLQVLYFPTDRERAQVHVYKAAQASLRLDAAPLNDYCNRKNITPRTLLLAAYKMALSRLTGLTDIVVGTTMDLRNDSIKELAGPVENLVVLRTVLDRDKSLTMLCRTVEQEWAEAENYKAMPFDKLVTMLNPKKDMSRTALFDMLFAYQQADGANSTEDITNCWGKYDFNLLATAGTQHYDLTLSFNELYFEHYTVQALLDLVERLVLTTISAGDTLLKNVPLLSAEEQAILAEEKGGGYKRSKDSLISRFKEQANLHPNNTALTWASGSMTYAALDESSDQLAGFLATHYQIGNGDKVAVMLPRSGQLVVAIFAILKCGAAYVPIDAAYPEDRRAFMLEDAGCRVMVDESLLEEFAAAAITSYTVPTIKPDNLAYIIYTSGTTGRPKGVMIEHRNVIGLLDSCYQDFSLSEKDTWTLFHSYCFDVSVWEMFGCLLSGGKLVILTTEEARSADTTAQLINTHEVTVFSQTPSAFYAMIIADHLTPSLRYVVFAGEALNPFKLRNWSRLHPGTQLINMYGITETTVHVTFKNLTPAELEVPGSNIGKPLSFANVYIMDAEQQLLPFGRPGELYVSGECVARGYLNRPELNAERFITYAFPNGKKRLYKSGDLVRFLPSGEMDYLGRADDQVKVRGYRIEPGEIRNQLDTCPGVKQSVVTLFEMPDGDKSIVAYVVLAGDVSMDDVKVHLAGRIPEYMMPSFFVKMDTMPLNANGKADKKRLPSPLDQAGDQQQAIVPPTDDVEQQLFDIWASLLNTTAFGIRHSFFDLGGHSLKATRLTAAIHKAFNVRLELKQIFSNPILEQQAVLIRQAGKQQYAEIPVAANADSYPVSDGQRRLWVLSQFGDAAVAYHMPDRIALKGPYDIPRFIGAIHAVIERHEILRTVFRADAAGEIRQWVLPADQTGFSIVRQDFRTASNPKEAAQAFITSDNNHPFDLENGPLLRAALLQVGEEEHVFYFNMHHIISDGWSMEVLAKDVMAFYEAADNRPALRIQYKDYAAWQQQQLTGEAYTRHREYWLQQLSGELPQLELPGSSMRPRVKTYNGHVLHTTLPATLTRSLHTFSRENGGSLFMSLLSVWNVLLYRYTRQADLMVGVPVAGRDHTDLTHQIGFYVNTLVLRNQINPEHTFAQIYDTVKTNTLAAYEHQQYPFDRLVDELHLHHDTSRNPVFDVMFILQNTGDKDAGDVNTIVSDAITDGNNTASKVDLSVFFRETGDHLDFSINYNTDIYGRDQIAALMEHFRVLLSNLLAQPDVAAGRIGLLTAGEEHTLLHTFNNSAADYQRDATVPEVFRHQVAQTPDHTALIFEDQKLTYRQLDELSDRMAAWLLQQYDLKPEDLVAMRLERSHWVVITALAVLKTGAAYVPIDTKYPADRVEYMISDSRCKVAIDTDLIAAFTAAGMQELPALPPIPTTSRGLMYMIYTSGSTGRPKGVMIEHHSVVNLAKGTKHYAFSTDDVLLATGSLSFDVSVIEFFGILLNGGTLIMCTDSNLLDPTSMAALIIQEQVNVMWFSAGWMHQLIDHDITMFAPLRTIIAGGDKLSPPHFARLRAAYPETQMINGYGPTENTIFSIVYPMKEINGDIPIGYPVSNCTIYILDGDRQLLPVGVSGEIYLGGVGLARGYWDRPELTAEKFVPHPFIPGERLYKTGDMGRWTAAGYVEFQGRNDDQIKIRGFRVEPGEIEQAILEDETILQAVVDIRVIGGVKSLVAYIAAEGTPDKKAIRERLAGKMPEHMIPGYFVTLAQLPLSANGKVAKRQLPDPGEEDLLHETFIAPRTIEEKVLAKVWQQVLKTATISVRDNFYNLGGDSIKSIQVIAGLKAQGYLLRAEQLLHHPVLEQQARMIEKKTLLTDQSAVTGAVVLTPIQQYFFRDMHIAQYHHFNQSVLLKSAAAVDTDLLTACIRRLMEHHDALRMTFLHNNGQWEQFNHAPGDVIPAVAFHDLRNESDEAAAMSRIGAAMQAGIDLEKGPLFHVGHFRMADGDRVALIIHHLVVDGISWRILLEDLSVLYRQAKSGQPLQLPLKTDAFRRWASLQQEYAHNSPQLATERAYWENISRTDVPVLPTDRPVTGNTTPDGVVAVKLDNATTRMLQSQVHQVYNTEINDVLLTALATAVKKILGVDRTLLKMEGHGREPFKDDLDITRTIGWFTTIYPMLLEISSEDQLANLVQVKESLRNIPRKGFGYGMLRYLTPEGLPPVTARIVFNNLGDFSNNSIGDSEASDFTFADGDIGPSADTGNGNDILLQVTTIFTGDELGLQLKYPAAAWFPETMNRLATAYQEELTALVHTLAAQQQRYLTPSDLTYKGLSLETLARLNASHTLEDVYPLSPLQHGLYYHWLMDPHSSAYLEQIFYKARATMTDREVYKKAFEALVDRYPVLRTAFGDHGKIHLQEVYKKYNTHFEWITLSADKKDLPAQIENLKQQDREKGFDLSAPSQIRLTVMDLSDGTLGFLWNFHHILMDGWCLGILAEEYYELVLAEAQQRRAVLPAVTPYSDYLRWLDAYDNHAATAFWNNYLNDYTQEATLPFSLRNAPKDVFRNRKERIVIDGELFAGLDALCKKMNITRNIFMQLVWGLLLSKYNHTRDVVFGAVVSGRPAELPGVDTMIGLFINTVPVRVRYEADDTPVTLLARLHREAIAASSYHHLSLTEIQAQSPLGRKMINHLMAFDNYPLKEMVEEGMDQAAPGVFELISDSVDVIEQTNYDFTVSMAPSDHHISVAFNYNGARYDEVLVKKAADDMQLLIRRLLQHVNDPLDSLGHLSAEETDTAMALSLDMELLKENF